MHSCLLNWMDQTFLYAIKALKYKEYFINEFRQKYTYKHELIDFEQDNESKICRFMKKMVYCIHVKRRFRLWIHSRGKGSKTT